MIVAAVLLSPVAVAVTSGPLYVVNARVSAGMTRDGLWRPTMVQARAARAALGRYLHSDEVDRLSTFQQARANEVAARFDSYTMQAEGVRAPGERTFYGTDGYGAKQIHLDGLCSSITGGKQRQVATEMVEVFDGGSCVFQAMYDVGSGRITFFQSNGYA